MSPNTKNNSPIVFMTNYKTNNNFNFRLYTGLRSKDERVLLGGADISKKYKKMSVNYSKRYRRMAGSFGETLDYSELKGQININSKIKLYAQIKQDDKQKKIIENTIGVEYEDCCYKFRLVGKDRDYSNFNVYNNNNNYQYLQDAFRDLIQIQSKGSISFEFELKGFNSSFDKVGRLFNNSLSNY
jgi:lipopolysaccharide assembly outer membrane protein LptD (OstA)